MITIVLVIHLLLAIALIAVILLQKSEGGALGMGGGGMSGFMTGRSTANLLTRSTAILALLFFLTSIGLALLAGNQRAPRSVVDVPTESPAPPATPAAPLSSTPPAAPSTPAAPPPPASSAPAPPAPSTPAPAPAAPAPVAPAPEPAAPSAPLPK